MTKFVKFANTDGETVCVNMANVDHLLLDGETIVIVFSRGHRMETKAGLDYLMAGLLVTEDAMQWRGNHAKSDGPIVKMAAINSGVHVEWRDEPNDKIQGELRAEYGSIWSKATDLSAFWYAFKSLKGE